jgi:hypothetical protein
MARKRTVQRKPWWKCQEEIAFLFEKLFRPIEAQVLHDTRRRDAVGVMRQLDVGVIDERLGERRVVALVEVQKRKSRVGIEEFGGWIYKRDSLNANELVVVSEQGFTRPTLAHVRKLHSDRVRLGKLHEVETGVIERINSTCLGVTRILDIWWFASAFVQFADANEVRGVNIHKLDTESPIFEATPNRGGSATSLMGLIRQGESSRGEVTSGDMLPFIVDVDSTLSFAGRPLKRILITAEKQRRIWEPNTRFYAYEEQHPNSTQRGIAIVSTFRVDYSRTGTLTLVITPDEAGTAGSARVAGQFQFS